MVKLAFARDPITKELQADAVMLVGERLKNFCEQIKAGECFRVSLPFSQITIDGRPAQMKLRARKYQGEDAETATHRIKLRTGSLAGKFQAIFDAAGEEFSVHYRATKMRNATSILLKPYKKGDIIDIWMSVTDMRYSAFASYFSKFNCIGIKRDKINIATAQIAVPDQS